MSAAAVWVAGVRLSDATDVLSHRLGLGEALGGLLLLAFATNLPEIAITASAALGHQLGIAIGNILGGIAIQTVVLVLIDVVGTRGGPPLTRRASSLQLIVEATLVVGVLVIAIMGTQLPPSLTVGRIEPAALLIVLVWIVGVRLVGNAPESLTEPRRHSRRKKADQATARGEGTARTALLFGAAAVVTLAGGVALEESGTRIADHIGMSGVLFGSTVLAASTALPEVSTGLASARLGDWNLTVSDIFGGNAFLPVLFLLASLLSGDAVLPSAQASDIYLAALGVLLTVVYAWGLVFRPQRKRAGMGADSLAVLLMYVLGIAGLVAISGG